MSHNERHQNYYRNKYGRTPYSHKPPYYRTPPYNSANSRYQLDNTNSDQRPSSRNRYPVNNYGNKFRNPQEQFQGRESDRRFSNTRFNNDQNYPIQPETNESLLERKAQELLDIVLRQPGIRSKIIFLETTDSPVQILQGTVDYFQLKMSIDTLDNGSFVIKIDEEVLAQGVFPNKQAAKSALAEQAIELLKKDCFYITKKKVYEEVCTNESTTSKPTPQSSFTDDNKAYQMMLKMGWSGKGLGVKEQGVQETLAETIEQNITKEGLGSSDVFKKVNKILEDYASSSKISMLRFDPDFTSEERAHIHKIAMKFGLKSKSEGKGEQRRITVTKKLHRADLVFNLLVNDMENTLYKLQIPSNFSHHWKP
ncbi:NF-kappa-B-repressing factor-like [Sitophilus oryzae]|uniref:NF-kappa-B-repressing factor-like n=1 Tax=Sitophilus oryzae TaxID=7048 RepID=A0A6J2XSA0_SITOR|nr:NF-kappa-B-repressing factor-like [Sitophilus oryzae]